MKSIIILINIVIGYFIIPAHFKGICTELNTSLHTNETGCILLTPNNSHCVHEINLPNRTSVISFSYNQPKESKINEGHIYVNFNESEKLVTVWNLTSEEITGNMTFISQTSKLKVYFYTEGNWTNIVFTYKELKFAINTIKIINDSGIMGINADCTNTITICNFAPLPNQWNESSIMITVEKLIIDDISGEYVSIGSGKKPFIGPPALLLTENIIKPEQYYIATDYAYILFFARSSSQKAQIIIKWERSGKSLNKTDENNDEKLPKDSLLQAVQVCIYNYSIIEEFNFTESTIGPLPVFRAIVANLANNYAKQKKIHLYQDIISNQVQIFRISSIIKPGDNFAFPNGVLFVMVTIVQNYDNNSAIFRWNQMQEIMQHYYKHDEKNKEINLKVGTCPQITDYNSWITATAVIAVICICLFIAMWIITYKMIWKSKKINNDFNEQTENNFERHSELKINENWIFKQKLKKHKTQKQHIWKIWKINDDVQSNQQEATNENIENAKNELFVNHEGRTET